MSCTPCRNGRHPDCTNRGCVCDWHDHPTPHPSLKPPPEWGRPTHQPCADPRCKQPVPVAVMACEKCGTYLTGRDNTGAA